VHGSSVAEMLKQAGDLRQIDRLVQLPVNTNDTALAVAHTSCVQRAGEDNVVSAFSAVLSEAVFHAFGW